MDDKLRDAATSCIRAHRAAHEARTGDSFQSRLADDEAQARADDLLKLVRGNQDWFN